MKQTWLNFTREDRERIIENYNTFWPLYKKGYVRGPYSIWPHDWTLYMSPIERNVWSDIRFNGLEVYPQVPCGNYFIDFANPFFGLAIEVDGKEWHKDKTKDEIRDQYLREHGYREIVRIEGRHSYADEGSLEDGEVEEDESYTIIQQLARRYRDEPLEEVGKPVSLSDVLLEMRLGGVEPMDLITMDELERRA